jgi:hypothetical protein
MLMAAGSDTPFVVSYLAIPLVAVLVLLPFLRGRPERLRASLLYGALGLFAATVGMEVATVHTGPHDWFAKYGEGCWPVSIMCGAAIGAIIGAWLRR